MIYPAVQLREDGRVVECPNCHNEEVEIGEFCKICGKVIINRCARRMYEPSYEEEYSSPCKESEGKPLPGNARFCPYCGSKTTFFENELLPPWEQVQPLPELRDEELPF